MSLHSSCWWGQAWEKGGCSHPMLCSGGFFSQELGVGPHARQEAALGLMQHIPGNHFAGGVCGKAPEAHVLDGAQVEQSQQINEATTRLCHHRIRHAVKTTGDVSPKPEEPLPMSRGQYHGQPGVRRPEMEPALLS